MESVEGNDVARDIQFLQAFLGGGDFVGFIVAAAVRQHERRIGSENVEDLFGLHVVEGIKTAAENPRRLPVSSS